MTREQFLERFQRLSGTDQAGLSALAKEMMDDARENVRAAAQLWAAYDPASEPKAAALLSELEELAFVPLTERGDPRDPQHRVWLLRMAGSSQLDLRTKLIALIHRMLDDRRTPPARRTSEPPMEENPALARVCDEAYLVHRQLLNFSESREQYFQNARAFLALPEHQKDAEIRNLKESNTWKKLTAVR